MSSGKIKLFAIYSFCLIIFIADRITKYFALNKLHEKGVYFFTNIGFQKQINRGLAFSIQIPITIILIATTTIILFLMFYFIKNIENKNYIKIILLAIIITGAISNLIDRVLYNGVIDFIKIYSFPIFNIADICISIPIIIYILSEIKSAPHS